MSVGDWPTYTIDGFSGEFVIPPTASDPYNGELDPRSIHDDMADPVLEIIRSELPDTQETIDLADPEFARGEDLGIFKIDPDTGVSLKKHNFTYVLGEDEYSALSGINGTFMPLIRIEDKVSALGVHPHPNLKQYRTKNVNPFVTDQNWEPQHANMELAQIVSLRAFRWSRGKERLAYHDRTYIPKPGAMLLTPRQLAIAQKFSIKIFNPFAPVNNY